YEATCRLRRFDGVYRPFRLQGAPVCAADGTLCEWVCCGTVSTRQNQTEEQAALAQTPQEDGVCLSEVEALLEAMTDGVLVYNAGVHALQSNQAMHTTLAVQPDPDFVALPQEERFRRLHIRNAQGVLLPLEQTPQMRLLRGETIRMEEAEDFQVRGLDGREI